MGTRTLGENVGTFASGKARGNREQARLMKRFNLVPRAFPLVIWHGREKTLASAGHVTFLHPKILGVINFLLHKYSK